MPVASVAIVGGGFIGAAAARLLDAKGLAVTVVSRAPTPVLRGNINWQYGDVASAEALDAVRSCDAMIYASGSLIPATQIGSVSDAVGKEVLPVLRLAEAAAEGASRRGGAIVFISSGGTVYGPGAPIPTPEDCRTAPISFYGMVKVMTEQALFEIGRKTGAAVVNLRVSNPYGPGQVGTRRLGFIAAAVHAAVADKPITLWGDGSITRDFIYIDDVSAAIAAAVLYRDGCIVLNIGSGVERSLLEVCDLVGRSRGAPLEITFEPPRDFDVKRSVLDITLARCLLSWKPEVELAQGIAATMRNVV